MIRLIEGALECADILSGDNALCARIDALVRTYAGESAFAGFYLQENGGMPTALVGLVDGAATVFCLDGADFDELSSFLMIRSYRSILCETSFCERLGIQPDASGPLLKLRSSRPSERAFTAGRKAGRFELENVFGVLAAAGMVKAVEKGPWLADVAARLNSGSSDVFAVFEGGEAVACAMIVHASSSAAVIGAVATLPAYRGRGYAKGLVVHASEQAAGTGRSVYLLCESAAMQQFYSGCGFEPHGSWSSAERAAI